MIITSGVLFSTGLIFLFQNCSQPAVPKLSFNFEKISSNVPSIGLVSAGNGEGYGGKLNGIYAHVDYGNYCGQNSVTELHIRDQIEISNNTAIYTIRDCQRLQSPTLFSLSDIQTRAQSGRVVIMQDEIFQKGSWISSGIVPREAYVNIYCQGKDLNALPNTQRIVDLFVNDSVLESQFKDSLLTSVQSSSFSSSFILSGQLQITDLSIDKNQILSALNLTYNVQNVISTSSSTSVLRNMINFYDGNNPLSSMFSTNYLSISSINVLRPEQLNYFLTPSATVPETVSAPICWKHQ